MEELAQALATVSTIPALSVAAKVSDIFESPLYERLFSEDNLQHVQLLVFATNVLRGSHLALKDTKDKTSKLAPLAPNRFRFLATRVLVRWVVKHEPEKVNQWGQKVVLRPGPKHPFREWLRKLMSPQNAKLQTLIPEIWDGPDGWPSGTDKEASDRLLAKLRLGEFDAFSEYREP